MKVNTLTNVLAVFLGVVFPWVVWTIVELNDDKYLFYILYAILASFVSIVAFLVNHIIWNNIFKQKIQLSNLFLFIMMACLSVLLKFILLIQSDFIYGLIIWFFMCLSLCVLFYLIHLKSRK